VSQASEASVLLAMTLILGGIACAFIGKGMTEVQMVIVAVLACALLEVAVQKVHDYYLYVSTLHKEHSEDKRFAVLFTVVRGLMGFLQLFILLLWNASMYNINNASKFDISIDGKSRGDTSIVPTHMRNICTIM